ncbi:MAG: GNAT family N-acetyltransferase [Candidatus Zixiibacteriota bacterium]|nr:MAG: GNAT family N-acetyltransferase [candidate division Zixibacteria bacterium]
MNIENTKTSKDFIAHLELTEVEAWNDFCCAAPRDAVEVCGIQFTRTRSSCFSIVPCVDTLVFNRIVGLGVTEPVTESTLDKVISLYKQANVPRFFIQLHPECLTPETRQLLERKRFRHYNNWVKLFRDTIPMPPVDTDLRVEEISPADASVFANILINSFEWSEFLQSWVEGSVGRPGWRHYLAFDGDKPVATGALFVSGRFGWIDFASTLPIARGRGAQSSLVERRIIDAAQQRCKWLVVETAEDKPERPAPSFRNMIRHGFQVAYVRPNYIRHNDSGD